MADEYTHCNTDGLSGDFNHSYTKEEWEYGKAVLRRIEQGCTIERLIYDIKEERDG